MTERSGGPRPAGIVDVMMALGAAQMATTPEAAATAAVGAMAMESADADVRAIGAGAFAAAMAAMIPLPAEIVCPVCGVRGREDENGDWRCPRRCAAYLDGEWYLRREATP